MTTGSEWRQQVGRSWADNYRLTDRAFSGLTERLLGRIGGCDGKAGLDIGCGAGELSLALARGNPQSRLVGVDVSADLVAAARLRSEALENVSFVEADAAHWKPNDFAPDVLYSRHGVMFFDVPVMAFANLRQIAQPGARLVFSCFRSASLNPWATELARLLELPQVGEGIAPGPFAFADQSYVRGILDNAGWRSIAFEEVDFAYVAGAGEDPVGDALQFFGRIGPAAPAMRALDDSGRKRAEDWLRTWLEDHRSGNLVAFEAAAWIVTAHA
ncbi:MAG: class I SAM-dependent methyltransferase [Novosphingobium sp.]|uniref:class I SAM-dependent methyltransferase n=1 Tax=Novosphingobium sp. TaxID=1874826 RepID=UPI0032BE4ED2